MIHLPLLDQKILTRAHNEKIQVYDPLRKRWVAFTPEEHVRQLLIAYLSQTAGYPVAFMAAEKEVRLLHLRRRFDLLIFNRDHRPWMLAECKEPGVPVTDDTLHQLLAYHSRIPCRFWLLTNGIQTYCADSADPDNILWLDALPAYDL